MSEVEKMYENAGVKFIIGVHCMAKIGDGCKSRCPDCDYNTKPKEYPPFTAEKQLEIVKMILFSTWWMNLKRLQFSEKFDEGLAQMINELWQDLTEQERTEIADILKG